MKIKSKKSGKAILSDKIADALTVKPAPDIEDDQVFGTKPHTISRDDLSSSDSDADASISDFRKRNVNLLSDISKKYEGQVVSRKEPDENDHEESDSDSDHNLLTVQDLLLNGDGDSSDAEGSIIKQSLAKDIHKSEVEPKTNSYTDSSHNNEKLSLKGIQSPSKSNKKTTIDSIQSSDDSDVDNSNINKILKNIGISTKKIPTKNNVKQIKTASESKTSSNKSDDDDYNITIFQKTLNKSQEKQTLGKKLKLSRESSFEPEDQSSGGESDDYDISKFQKTLNKSQQKQNYDKKENIPKDTLSESDQTDAESEDSINQKKESGKDDEEESDREEEEEGFDISEMQGQAQEEFEHVKKQNISEEAKKGACVRNQLLLWEGLLEMRIHLQRCMNTANQMPMSETYEELKTSNEFTEECNAAKANVATVLDKFLTLQNLLLKNNPETKSLCNSKEQVNPNSSKQDSQIQDDEEIPSDTDNEEIPSDTEEEEDSPQNDKTPVKNTNITSTRKRKLQDYETELSKSHKSFKTFRDGTIQKWNEKTRLATTNIKTTSNTILQQISYILSDRDKLVRRTQLKRSEYDIVGYKSKQEKDLKETELPTTKDRKDDDEYISEIFDDSDFYHQLLRELIECKSADISDPVQLSRQWIALQQMRSKMKRKVDTKATKGRKIKYVVHNQLVNYMAPEKCTTWTDESTNELYSSLFGKMYEHNNAGLNANIADSGFKIKN